jgi:hypothetical protein
MGVGITEEEVDVARLLREGQTAGALHVVLPRGRDERWLVAHSPIQLHERIRWGQVRDGDFVFVPIVPYRTHQDANKAIKFALTIGLRAGLDVNLLPGRDIRRIYMVTGTVTEDLAETEGIQAFRFYLGFAIQTH